MDRAFRGAAAGRAVPLVLLFALACSDGSEPSGGGDPTTGALGGSVTAGSAGVAGATITLGGAATGERTTPATGAYLFDDLAPGAYTATVTLPEGFSLADGETAAKTANVTAGSTSPVNWSAVEDGAAGVTVVTVGGTAFTPANVTIAPGETVRWVVNNGTHTVTPDSPGLPGAWTGTGQLGAGQEFQHTFTALGTYDYHCIPHQSLGMTGTVTVE